MPVRNQIIRDALDNARDLLDRAEVTVLSSAVECLYTAVREMASSKDDAPDAYDFWFGDNSPDSSAGYYSDEDYAYPDADDDWHVSLYVEHQIFLGSAERRAEHARLRAIAEAGLRKAGKIK